jgi:hypothetical protein
MSDMELGESEYMAIEDVKNRLGITDAGLFELVRLEKLESWIVGGMVSVDYGETLQLTRPFKIHSSAAIVVLNGFASGEAVVDLAFRRIKNGQIRCNRNNLRFTTDSFRKVQEEIGMANNAERSEAWKSEPKADIQAGIGSQGRAKPFNVKAGAQIGEDRILSKAALISALKSHVRPDVNLDSLLSNACKYPALSACKADKGRGWKLRSVCVFLADKGHLKQEHMDQLGKAGLDKLLQELVKS